MTYDLVFIRVGSHTELILAPQNSHINEGDEVQTVQYGNNYPVLCVMRSITDSAPIFENLSYAFAGSGDLKRVYAITTTKEVIWDE